jgi:hypothetical protein
MILGLFVNETSSRARCGPDGTANDSPNRAANDRTDGSARDTAPDRSSGLFVTVTVGASRVVPFDRFPAHNAIFSGGFVFDRSILGHCRSPFTMCAPIGALITVR